MLESPMLSQCSTVEGAFIKFLFSHSYINRKIYKPGNVTALALTRNS